MREVRDSHLLSSQLGDHMLHTAGEGNYSCQKMTVYGLFIFTTIAISSCQR
uniref:Uncharacterized protein n=1 Tax=Physcomitrium patens TaxID=3218 RepID=A0A2K1L858_PHYPA|nr:hypothetical protein PHYPA_000643 [Physcomitrium patens]